MNRVFVIAVLILPLAGQVTLAQPPGFPPLPTRESMDKAKADAQQQLKGIKQQLDQKLSELIQGLESDDLANQAATTLREAGPRSIAALMEAIESTNPQVRSLAAEAIGGIPGKEQLPALRSLLVDDDEVVRAAAIDAIGKSPSQDPATASSLLQAMKSDPSASVRSRAAQALGKHAESSEVINELLSSITSEDNATVAKAAVRGLASDAGSDAKAAVLVKALMTANGELAAEITDQLAQMGPTGLNALMGALDDERSRFWAVIGIAEFGEDAVQAASPMAAMLSESTPDVKVEILMALSAIGSTSNDVQQAVTEQLTSELNSVRYAATYAVARLGLTGESMTRSLTESMNSDDAVLRLVSAFALAKLNPTRPQYGLRAMAALRDSIASGDPKLKEIASAALADLKSSG